MAETDTNMAGADGGMVEATGGDMDYHALLAALDWQVELGAIDPIGEMPVDRHALPDAGPRLEAWVRKAAPVAGAPGKADRVQPAPAHPAAPIPEADPVDEARAAAAAAQSLDALLAALDAYPHCSLRRGARSLVFSDGRPEARVMIVGEAPGADEDRLGKPFVGRAGQLLDRMLDAIGLDRAAPDAGRAVYITNVLPWRPPQNRDPTPEEVAMLKPFVERHIELADPDVLLLMGNISCHALLGRKGITRLRGTWAEAAGRPALPMFHPAYLLRNPAMKRHAWSDLLDVKARLRG